MANLILSRLQRIHANDLMMSLSTRVEVNIIQFKKKLLRSKRFLGDTYHITPADSRIIKGNALTLYLRRNLWWRWDVGLSVN